MRRKTHNSFDVKRVSRGLKYRAREHVVGRVAWPFGERGIGVDCVGDVVDLAPGGDPRGELRDRLPRSVADDGGANEAAFRIADQLGPPSIGAVRDSPIQLRVVVTLNDGPGAPSVSCCGRVEPDPGDLGVGEGDRRDAVVIDAAAGT